MGPRRHRPAAAAPAAAARPSCRPGTWRRRQSRRAGRTWRRHGWGEAPTGPAAQPLQPPVGDPRRPARAQGQARRKKTKKQQRTADTAARGRRAQEGRQADSTWSSIALPRSGHRSARWSGRNRVRRVPPVTTPAAREPPNARAPRAQARRARRDARQQATTTATAGTHGTVRNLRN